ncbi:hypothetical protein K435DRAFT_807197 [Dendrothele bispora CBS 962.96]|uniref:Uncharacterized protein n=1 Tax=Dendrothele bispora (strain CBS 962.96) TaxID=1314807 RepID=A0A4S8L5E0_DENBC|nr:hypothetical protein K435DRAFT_807197 [Dendrothele bispora CBS 962.96]
MWADEDQISNEEKEEPFRTDKCLNPSFNLYPSSYAYSRSTLPSSPLCSFDDDAFSYKMVKSLIIRASSTIPRFANTLHQEDRVRLKDKEAEERRAAVADASGIPKSVDAAVEVTATTVDGVEVDQAARDTDNTSGAAKYAEETSSQYYPGSEGPLGCQHSAAMDLWDFKEVEEVAAEVVGVAGLLAVKDFPWLFSTI